MTASTNAAPGAAPVFSARITPNASLSRAGFIAVVGGTALAGFAAGLIFVAKGAWPVLPFLGLDVLLVWLAFRAYRMKTHAYEEVRVTGEELLVRRVSAAGAVREFRFNPYWIRLTRHIVEDQGLVGVALTSHGKSFPIAHYLSPSERERFARALDDALATVKRGP
jgi:uncharacterized membrane protein